MRHLEATSGSPAAGKRNTLLVAALLAVIIPVVIFAAKKLNASMTPPCRHLDTPIQLIDTETFELVSRKADEWKILGFEGTRYRNPRTGKYTMAVLSHCESCGQPIPFPDRPPIPVKKVRPEMSDAEMDTIIADVLAKREEALYAYKCPRCEAPHPITGVDP